MAESMLPIGHRPRRVPATPAPSIAADASPRPIGSAPRPTPLADSTKIRLLIGRETTSLRAQIDIAVTPSGIWLIHARPGRQVVLTRKPLRGEPMLTISGRDRGDLISDLRRQVAGVEGMLLTAGQPVPVDAVIVCPDARAPASRLVPVGVRLLFGPRALDELLHRPGPLSADRIAALAATLDEAFPTASLAA